MISKRIEEVFKKSDMNLQLFANRIGVSKASISHVFNGRNRPSLDLIKKINLVFPQYSLEWLIKGVESAASSGEKEIVIQKEIEVKSKKIKKIMIFYDDDTFEEFHH